MNVPDLTSKDKMTRYMSLQGIVAFSDHEDCGEEDDLVIQDCIDRASGEVAGSLYPLYKLENLETNKLVCQWATVIACFYLCKRRGNNVPESLYDDYEQITGLPDGLIERTRTEKFILPCVPKQSHNIPTFSNLTVDRRYRREQVRVTKANSSPIPSTIEQDRAPESGSN